MTPIGAILHRCSVGSDPESIAVGPGGRVWVSVTGAEEARLVRRDRSPIRRRHDVVRRRESAARWRSSPDGDGQIYFSLPEPGRPRRLRRRCRRVGPSMADTGGAVLDLRPIAGHGLRPRCLQRASCTCRPRRRRDPARPARETCHRQRDDLGPGRAGRHRRRRQRDLWVTQSTTSAAWRTSRSHRTAAACGRVPADRRDAQRIRSGSSSAPTAASTSSATRRQHRSRGLRRAAGACSSSTSAAASRRTSRTVRTATSTSPTAARRRVGAFSAPPPRATDRCGERAQRVGRVGHRDRRLARQRHAGHLRLRADARRTGRRRS